MESSTTPPFWLAPRNSFALLVFLPGSGSQHEVRVVETNYNDYALLSTKKIKGAETFTMVTLYGMHVPIFLTSCFPLAHSPSSQFPSSAL